MTKKLTLPLGIMMVALTLLVGGLVWAGVQGTMHDMRSNGTQTTRASAADSIYSACSFCHTPHAATRNGAWRPLWNMHDTTTKSLTWNPVTTVRGDTLPTNMAGSTRACMSCHDGTVAIGNLLNYGGHTKGATMIGNVSGNKMIGGNRVNADSMSQNHPVGLPLPPPKIGFSSYNIPPSDPIVAARYANEGNLVNCGTCHEPHGIYGYRQFCVASPEDTLCLACHQN